ncbi:class I SAM-dependent methyltransferase [Roseobacteraceae bacterium NS-SX3]
MAYDYDKLYRGTPNALGSPSPAFVAFFNALDEKGLRVLDVGCGQGRDALFIARLGHSVTGVDISPHGIKDLTAAAAREDLDIEGHVADLAAFRPSGLFGIILIDRTLHMLAEADRLAVLARLLEHAAPGGWVLIADERANLPGFRDVFAASPADWQTVKDERGYLFMRRGP